MEQITWNKVIEELRKSTEIDRMVINAFFCKADFRSFTPEKAVISCENEISKIIIEKSIQEIRHSIETLFSVKPTCIVEVKSKDSITVKERESFPVIRCCLPNAGLRFENFAVSHSNEMCVDEILNRLSQPEQEFDPLLIQGAEGTGKTHLLHAVGNYVREKYAPRKVCYLNAKDLLNLVISNAGKHNNLINEMADLDVVLIDDVHLVETHQKTCEILSEVFERLIMKEKLIFVTASNKEIEHSYLRNVLNLFQVVSLHAIDIITAKMITKLKINTDIGKALDFDEQAIEYIAMNYCSNAHQLDACIQKILFWSIQSFGENYVDLEIAKKILDKNDPIRNETL